jgi:hypothetical protein
MAEGFARYRLRSREAGQLYAAWRGATRAVCDRLLDLIDFHFFCLLCFDQRSDWLSASNLAKEKSMSAETHTEPE